LFARECCVLEKSEREREKREGEGEGGREREKEGGREGWREGGRERDWCVCVCVCARARVCVSAQSGSPFDVVAWAGNYAPYKCALPMHRGRADGEKDIGRDGQRDRDRDRQSTST
jgi:hypothetical protein